ncbi:MAG: hypothetical protein R3331_02895 [Sulfurospirillaceae bacterium]|nr:hypothetical protein [Sulfurospirillaceae bacterium]
MASIRILEDIGLKEVSRKTHIEVKFLEYIINSEFDKLNKTNSIGFAKIISREYDLDFTDWLEEARQYWDEQIPEQEHNKIFIVQKPKKYTKVIFTLLSLIVLVAILYGAYMFLNKKLNFFEDTVLKKDINYTYEETPVVSEAKKSLSGNVKVDEVNTTAFTEDNNSTTVNTLPVTVDKNTSDESNKSFSNIQIKQDKVQENNSTSVALNINKDDFISPATKLWIGIIDLKTFKRSSYLGDGNYTIDPSKDQLITTGHGDFTLYFNGEVTKYNKIQPMKFMIKDGNISQISTKKFMELNRGSLW